MQIEFLPSCLVLGTLLMLGASDSVWGAPPEQSLPEKHEPVVISTKPAHADLLLSREMQAFIASSLVDRHKTVRLTLADVAPPHKASSVKAVRVFLNHGDADAKTSVKEAGYVGYLVFQPTVDDEPQSFVFDLAQPLQKLKESRKLDLAKPLKFTLVPISNDHAPLPDSLRLPVGNLTIEGLDRAPK